ncbi:hypothetical protein [Anaerosolibacter sp.]|uniref:hypothetical protein n=1 Tax=Anaerosolibacter sp. TaxID=1872527 RepID=UPI0039EFBCF6
MGRSINPIGGEFWFEPSIFKKDRNNFEAVKAVFLAGGQSAIRFIFESLEIKKNECVLIPAYICPSILYPLEQLKISYRFYKIKDNLSLDHEDLIQQVETHAVKAILFINYFGFYHKEDTQQLLKRFQQQGIKLIEDAVQMLWFQRQAFIGDYVFNSYRKFLPIDGSLVLCDTQKDFNPVIDDYDRLMNDGRMKKTAYIYFDIGTEEKYLDMFAKAEHAYYRRTQIVSMNNVSRNLLKQVDTDFIKQRRLENYIYLYDRLAQNREVKILFNISNIKENIPLGLPVFIKNRDDLRTKLRNHGIFCPVHWDITKEQWAIDHPNTLHVSKHILTIPIDQRYCKEDMDRLLDTLFKLF